MKVVGTIAELETAPGTGLVPTMGALHDGHVALLRAARQENRTVVMSLFVNPAQFDEQTDLDAGIEKEKEGFRKAFTSADARDGISAFLGKRAPKWQGK